MFLLFLTVIYFVLYMLVSLKLVLYSLLIIGTI